MRGLLLLLLVTASAVAAADCSESDINGDFALTLNTTAPDSANDAVTGVLVFDGAGKVQLKQLRVPIANSDGASFYIFKGYGSGRYSINAICTGNIRFTVRDSAEREAVAVVSAQVLLSGNRSSPSITGSAIIEDTYSEETGFLFNEDLFPQDIAYGKEGGATISLTPINF